MPQTSGRAAVSMRCLRRVAMGGVLVLLAVTSGCAGLRSMVPRPKVACVLPPNPTVEQVVTHVNMNVEKVQGYSASGMKIRANNIPLGGNLAIERGKRLRLLVSSPVGKEVDLGSNDEAFWIWAKRNEPAGVYYAAHADMDVARRNLPIPFEPEWLMEALGVSPLSAENVRMESPPNGPIRLVSQHQMPNGEPIRKVVVVDPCRGTVIEHSTYTANGQPLVRALLQDYRLDPTSGAMIARHIKLDWPQAQMSLAMDLGQIVVNPSATAPSVWEMPMVPGCPMVNLGQRRPSDVMIGDVPGKARISDEVSRVPRPEEKYAARPKDDEFWAPEIGGRGGSPIGFNEPSFSEPHMPGFEGPAAATTREPEMSVAPF